MVPIRIDVAARPPYKPAPPPGDRAVSSRLVLFLLAACLAAPAAPAQTAATPPPGWVPPGADPATGARPGNDIGTGMSLPTSDRAGNITPDDTASPIAARLPDPPVGDDAVLRDYLLAARNAMAAGRTGEAQEALERAETRALDRSVPLFQTGTPSADPTVARIAQVLHRLGDGDRQEAMRVLEQILAGRPR
jgi:hypothetical protein